LTREVEAEHFGGEDARRPTADLAGSGHYPDGRDVWLYFCRGGDGGVVFGGGDPNDAVVEVGLGILCRSMCDSTVFIGTCGVHSRTWVSDRPAAELPGYSGASDGVHSWTAELSSARPISIRSGAPR